ncbi:hypothetical protein ACLKA7_011072 [Drosophila subpalustris]
MRAFLMICLLAVAKGQYDYTPTSLSGDGRGGLIGTTGSGSDEGLVQHGSAQLSEPILIPNEFNKEFYTYSAPEQEFDNGQANEQIANALRRTLRVLFIKGPENTGLEQAALQLASSASDDRTAIYVLNKQADVGELTNKLNQIKLQSNNKPEVHFVKYRTQSDAENAQRVIQAQYDSLPGRSSNHNAGSSAPVLDFATKSGSVGIATVGASVEFKLLGLDEVEVQSQRPPKMKQFAVLVCLSCAVLAAAAPQGYKYQQNGPTVIQTGNLRPQTPLATSGIYSLPPQQQHPVIQTVLPPVQTIVNNVEPQVQLQVQHQVQSQPQPQQIVYQQPQQQQQFIQTVQQPQQQFVQTIQHPQQQQFVQTQFVQRPAIVTKDIYIHSAPDDTEEINQAGPQLDNVPVRKNYRIVFIKAPTQNLKHTAAALKRAQASNEEKTVIYVLSKKPDITEIQQHLQLSQTESKVHKPEVYFIKYKTTEEAQRAQQEIQAQYDALGGATHISDEGVAPITSFSGGSLNLGSIVPHHIQAQTIHQQPQTQTIVQTTQNAPLVGQGIQQQSSFLQQSGLQTTSLTSGSNFGVVQPSKRYVPAKTLK